jgi:hypothetical protein
MKRNRTIISVVSILLIQAATHSQEQLHTITGQTVNRKNAKIPFANVVIQRSGKGSFSDEEGNFKIEAGLSDTLLFSAIGYKTARFSCARMVYNNNVVVLDSLVYKLEEINIMELRSHELKYKIRESKPTYTEQKILVLPGLPDPYQEPVPVKPRLFLNPITALYEIFKAESRRKRKMARWNRIYQKSRGNIEQTIESDTLYLPGN